MVSGLALIMWEPLSKVCFWPWMTLNKGCNLAIAVSKQQVPLPVTWYRTIFNRGRSFADGYRVNDPVVIVSFLGVMARTAHRSCAPQMLQQLLLQSATGLYEEVAIDGFV